MGDLRVPDLNTVTIVGRLTREPELKYITTELRAVYREAYMAALGGACADTNVPNPVKDARWLALETVRQWPAMMAELEQEIPK